MRGIKVMENTNVVENKERYEAIDGLRAFSAIGIVIMHIKENGYVIDGFVSERIIGEMGNLVFVFMVISGFSMCCGYYEKIVKHQISLEQFYLKRYKKTWPFFALLCLIDVAFSPSLESLYELFANLTLCFGFLPNANIQVIGVGWFLGLVFAFYIVFPFFCCLLASKKRAWLSFAVALIFNLLCSNYFFDAGHMGNVSFDARTNIVYCFVFFLTGGLLYLYREQIKIIAEKFRLIVLLICLLAIALYVFIGRSVFTLLAVSAFLVVYAIGASSAGGVLRNRATHFISGISMEIYLSHMVFYRVVEKLGLLHLFKNEVISYIVGCMFILAGTMIFSVCVKTLFEKINFERIIQRDRRA